MAHGKNGQYWHTMNKAQQQACHRLFMRCNESTWLADCPISYLPFRRRFRLFDFYGGRDIGSYFGGEWRGIFYGIEHDGHTHT